MIVVDKTIQLKLEDRHKPKQKNKTILHSLIDGFFFCVGFNICLFILTKIFH